VTLNPLFDKILLIYKTSYNKKYLIQKLDNYKKFQMYNKMSSIINSKNKTSVKIKLNPKALLNLLLKQRLNFFIFFILDKEGLQKNKTLINKVFCFWPLLKKKVGFIYYKLNSLKKMHSLLFKNQLKKTKKISINKKNYYFNFHKKTIKYFWKSQEHFKINFLRKVRLTTSKFKKKFEQWYKKNKNIEILKHNNKPLAEFLLKNLIFSSIDFIKHLFAYGAILLNGEKISKQHEVIKINDIVYLPENYISQFFSYLKNKYNNIKKIKKIKFIYYKNKKSQWKSLKKKTPKILYDLVYNKNKFYNQVEVDFFSSKIMFIKNEKSFVKLNYESKRHNLEKLNTYKLNV
jgi:hypothetical protein